LADKPERTVRQVPRFAKSKRRLPPPIQEEIDRQVEVLLSEPHAGEPKRGALRGVRVVKFKAEDRQYLLAYLFDERKNVIEVLDASVGLTDLSPQRARPLPAEESTRRSAFARARARSSALRARITAIRSPSGISSRSLARAS